MDHDRIACNKCTCTGKCTACDGRGTIPCDACKGWGYTGGPGIKCCCAMMVGILLGLFLIYLGVMCVYGWKPIENISVLRSFQTAQCSASNSTTGNSSGNSTKPHSTPRNVASSTIVHNATNANTATFKALCPNLQLSCLKSAYFPNAIPSGVHYIAIGCGGLWFLGYCFCGCDMWHMNTFCWHMNAICVLFLTAVLCWALFFKYFLELRAVALLSGLLLLFQLLVALTCGLQAPFHLLDICREFPSIRGRKCRKCGDGGCREYVCGYLRYYVSDAGLLLLCCVKGTGTNQCRSCSGKGLCPQCRGRDESLRSVEFAWDGSDSDDVSSDFG